MAFADIMVSVPEVLLSISAGVVIIVLIFLLVWRWQHRKKAYLSVSPAPALPKIGEFNPLSTWKQKSVLPLENELAYLNAELQTLPQVEFSPGKKIMSLPSKSVLTARPSYTRVSLRSSAPKVIHSPAPVTISPELSRIEAELAGLGRTLPSPMPSKDSPVKNISLPVPPPPIPKSSSGTKIIPSGKDALTPRGMKVEQKTVPKVLLPPERKPEPKLQKEVQDIVATLGISEKRPSFFQRLFTHKPAIISSPSVVGKVNVQKLAAPVNADKLKGNVSGKKEVQVLPKATIFPQTTTKPTAPTLSSTEKISLQKTLLKPTTLDKKYPQPASPKLALPKPTSSTPRKNPFQGSLPEKDQLVRLQEGINQLKKRMESS